MFRELVDVKEDNILSFDKELLDILLKDRTTNKNIIWGTDNYSLYGPGFFEKDYITPEKITGKYGKLIKPRVRKTKEEQSKRIKDKAEVFTPSWICNRQNNIIDEEWFGYRNIFNIEDNNYWKATEEKIKFPEGKNWQEYIDLLRLEVSCGEAPYLISRYDTVTGNTINIKERIGIIDRKFRILNENCDNKENWIEFSKRIIKSSYGFDWQGDNVLLARENILYTYTDNYKNKFGIKPSAELIKEIGMIVSWNVWQMDGVNLVIPYSCKNDRKICSQLNLFGGEETLVEKCIGCKKNSIHKHNGIYSKIMNWKTNRPNKFINLIGRKKK